MHFGMTFAKRTLKPAYSVSCRPVAFLVAQILLLRDANPDVDLLVAVYAALDYCPGQHLLIKYKNSQVELLAHHRLDIR